MSNKPIEVGCRVLVVGDLDVPKNIGKVGIVVDFIPKGETRIGCVEAVSNAWGVESLGGNFTIIYQNGHESLSSVRHFYTECLIRLPDEDDVLEFDKKEENCEYFKGEIDARNLLC